MNLLNHVMFPSKRCNFRVDITKRERMLFERKIDEAKITMIKILLRFQRKRKSNESSLGSSRNLKGKEKKKVEAIDFGSI